ncbi:MAG: hypothetical protein EPO36_04350 [Chloroflexota bacterium]|nr:MAG: hypothetical protein EPO36_04350 [Chloroflexota bacterium]
MERLLSLYRGASTATAVASLVGANLVPLVGVLFWGWDLWTILALYWAENGIVGLWNIAKILRAEGPVPASAPAAARLISRAGVAMFFMVHYGIFWVVHGIFVIVALPAFGDVGQGGLGPPTPGDPGSLEPWLGGPGIRARLDLVAFGAIWLAISHGISYWTVYLGRGEYRLVSPQQQAQAPYGRLLVLHATIIFGALVSVMLGVPFGAMLVLVGLKLVLDLRFHLREHSRAIPPRGPPRAWT